MRTCTSIGVPNAKGLAAGQAYVGEIDGEKVRVIQLDDGSDPAASTRNARKLVEQEKVDFLIGTSGAPQTLAMATAAIEMKVPMVAVSPIAPVPAGEGGPWVVQIPQPTPAKPSWAHPVVVDGKLYLREQDRLYVYDVKA